MRVWLHSSVKSAAVHQSAIFSLVTHAALVGAAVYGTSEGGRLVMENFANQVFYLPPPDRRPSSEGRLEKLTYVDIGNGAAAQGQFVAGAKTPMPKGRELEDPGTSAGKDETSQAASLEVASPDSVYSVLDVEESAVRSAGSAAPVYPPELIKDKIEGAVFMRYIIDTTGRADPNSLEVIRSSHPAFTEAVRTAVPLMAFSPAMVGGHKVRQAVEQNFQFKIAPPVAAAPEHTRTKPAP
jgi:TonB family protein